MKFSVFQMNQGRVTKPRPETRTLTEFALETGQSVNVLGKAVKKNGLLPSIGKSYPLKALQALSKSTEIL